MNQSLTVINRSRIIKLVYNFIGFVALQAFNFLIIEQLLQVWFLSDPEKNTPKNITQMEQINILVLRIAVFITVIFVIYLIYLLIKWSRSDSAKRHADLIKVLENISNSHKDYTDVSIYALSNVIQDYFSYLQKHIEIKDNNGNTKGDHIYKSLSDYKKSSEYIDSAIKISQYNERLRGHRNADIIMLIRSEQEKKKYESNRSNP